MYKPRLKSWGLRKYFKKEEHEVAREAVDERTGQGPSLPVDVMVNGRRLPLHRLSRQFRADPTFAIALNQGARRWDQLALTYQLQACTAEDQIELMLRHIKAHWSITIKGNHETMPVLKARRARMEVTSHPNDVRNRLLGGLALVRRGKPAKGWKEIHYVCEQIGKVFELGEPNLLPEMIAVFSSVVWNDHAELFDQIARHFAYMANEYLGSQHPLTRIMIIVVTLVENLDAFQHFAERAFTLMMKTLEGDCGNTNTKRWRRVRLQTETEIISRMQHHLTPPECRAMIQNKLSSYKHDLGPRSAHTLNLAFLLGTTYEREESKTKGEVQCRAEAQYLWITDQGKRFRQDSCRIGSYPLAARRLGQMYFRRNDYTKSQEYYCIAWVWAAEKLGEHHPFTDLLIRDLSGLQLMYKKGLFERTTVYKYNGSRVVVAWNDNGESTVVDEVYVGEDGSRDAAAIVESDGIPLSNDDQCMDFVSPDKDMELDAALMNVQAGDGDEEYLDDFSWLAQYQE
ncbi:hypothetical protein EDD37DRAFT_568 [Exophiala viscosa]|uniref:uncharacterized protein n=1 Tax=Exophiala viscosa TaxID=2486360 RepID=UPI00219F951C|nr:hypothetical protein EDD37DRAFT_568 [Exophiala viscosa]